VWLDITVRQRWCQLVHGLYPSADLRRCIERVDRRSANIGAQEHEQLRLCSQHVLARQLHCAAQRPPAPAGKDAEPR